MTTRPLPIQPAAAGWRHPVRLACSLALLLPTCVSLAAVPPPLPPIRATEPPSTTQPPADPVDTISADAAARQGIGELMRSAHYWQAHYRPDITRSVLDKVLHVRADHAQALLLLGETELRTDRPDAARKALERLTRLGPQGRSEAAELRQLITLYTEQRSALDQLRQLRQRGRSAEVLALARRLFPDGRPPGSFASEFASVLASQAGGWESSRIYLEQRLARNPAPRDRLALAELDAQRPATRRRALTSLARLAGEGQLPADQLRRSWLRVIDQIGDAGQAAREHQALARALPVETPATAALPSPANTSAVLVAAAGSAVAPTNRKAGGPLIGLNAGNGAAQRAAGAADTPSERPPTAPASSTPDTAAAPAVAVATPPAPPTPPPRPEPPPRSRQLQAQAQALLDADRPAAARTLLTDHLAGMAPDALAAEGASRGLLGLAEMRLGRTDLARDHFVVALADDPGDAERWQVLRDTADYWGTLAEVRAALSARTVTTSSARSAGNAGGSRRPDPADAATLDALDASLARVLGLPSATGHEREATLLRADLARLQGRREAASAQVDPLCHADLAAAAPRGTRRDTRACELALAVRSDDQHIDAGLAELNTEAARRGPGAVDLLAQALDVGALRELADRRVELGRSNDARRLLENTLALRPQEPWLRHDLARLLQAQGRPASARGLMRQGLGLLLPAGFNTSASQAQPGRIAPLRRQAMVRTPGGEGTPQRSPAEIELRRAAALVALAGDDADEALALLSPDGEVIDADLYARARFDAAKLRVRKLLARYQPGQAVPGAPAATVDDAEPDTLADPSTEEVHAAAAGTRVDTGAGTTVLQELPAAAQPRAAWLPPRRSAATQAAPSQAASLQRATTHLAATPVALPPRPRHNRAATVPALPAGEEAELEAALQQVAALAGDNPERQAEVSRLRVGQTQAVEHQSQVEVGVFDGHRHASAGRGQLASREVTVRVTADSAGFGPLGPGVRKHLPDGRWWAQLDHTRLDAGALPAAWADAQDFGRVRQLGGAAAVPVDLPGAVPQHADGLAAGVGWERGEQQADLGLVGLGMPVPRLVGGWRWDRWGEDGGHLGVEIARRAETGTLLAWAGASDPVSGQTWGGVSQTALVLRGGLALLPAAASGQPGWLGDSLREASLDSSLRLGRMDGRHTAGNALLQWRGSLGLRFIDRPDLRLASGLNLDLWRYQRNEGFYTWGHGGYYSPQRYASIGIPLALDARGPAWTLALRVGVSRSRTDEDDAAVFLTDAAAQAASGDPQHRGGPGGGVGTSLRAMGEWQFASQWRLGLMLGLEQSSDYAPRRLGLYLRHGLGEQAAPAGFPLRPLGSYTRY